MPPNLQRAGGDVEGEVDEARATVVHIDHPAVKAVDVRGDVAAVTPSRGSARLKP